jgi:dolichol-phosphate mannosyltransferase
MTSSDLKLLSLIIPARDEEGCVAGTVKAINDILRAASIPHEIVVVDDGSTDNTWAVLQKLQKEVPELKPVRNEGPHGFGHTIVKGLNLSEGDAIAITMADASDSPHDLVLYWEKLNEGYECVFGSRFINGSVVEDYPKVKLIANRLANFFIRLIFRLKFNDITNAFKAYRREVIDGCQPLISPHFNLTVEIPLKAIVRGYSWTMVPISWKNRASGVAKLKIKEMGGRYFFICAYVWLEKYLSRGDYHRK